MDVAKIPCRTQIVIGTARPGCPAVGSVHVDPKWPAQTPLKSGKTLRPNKGKRRHIQRQLAFTTLAAITEMPEVISEIYFNGDADFPASSSVAPSRPHMKITVRATIITIWVFRGSSPHIVRTEGAPAPRPQTRGHQRASRIGRDGKDISRCLFPAYP
jgi:hypothetical protein